MSKWVTISIRKELAERARPAIERLGYRSLAEFVSEAIRLRLEQLEPFLTPKAPALGPGGGGCGAVGPDGGDEPREGREG